MHLTRDENLKKSQDWEFLTIPRKWTIRISLYFTFQVTTWYGKYKLILWQQFVRLFYFRNIITPFGIGIFFKIIGVCWHFGLLWWFDGWDKLSCCALDRILVILGHYSTAKRGRHNHTLETRLALWINQFQDLSSIFQNPRYPDMLMKFFIPSNASSLIKKSNSRY